MSISSGTIDFKFQIKETWDHGYDLVSDGLVTHEITGVNNTFGLPLTTGGTAASSSGATVPVTSVWSDELSLTTSPTSVDLTALSLPAGTGGSTTKDMSGLKLQGYKIYVAPGQTNDVIIKPHASNGYNIFGTAGYYRATSGEVVMAFCPESRPDVAAGAKVISFESSASTVICQVILLFG